MLKKLAVVYLWFILVPPFIILSAIFLTHPKSDISPIQNQALDISLTPIENNIEGQVLGIKIDDARPFIVAKFLDGTPLEHHSQLIVEVSDQYDLDYRLIPAIAMKESQAGSAIDQSTHNAWGFDNGRARFDSWESAIKIVARILKTQYLDKGLITPEEMMAVYAPPQLLTGGKWAKDINLFFSQMQTL